MIKIRNRDVPAVIGRLAAICVHPYAAWRVRGTLSRVMLVSAYAVGAYAIVLAALSL
jgi:hypothetical protein